MTVEVTQSVPDPADAGEIELSARPIDQRTVILVFTTVALGMLLAVPIMMAVKSICDHIEGLQPVGHLLGEGP